RNRCDGECLAARYVRAFDANSGDRSESEAEGQPSGRTHSRSHGKSGARLRPDQIVRTVLGFRPAPGRRLTRVPGSGFAAARETENEGARSEEQEARIALACRCFCFLLSASRYFRCAGTKSSITAFRIRSGGRRPSASRKS